MKLPFPIIGPDTEGPSTLRTDAKEPSSIGADAKDPAAIGISTEGLNPLGLMPSPIPQDFPRVTIAPLDEPGPESSGKDSERDDVSSPSGIRPVAGYVPILPSEDLKSYSDLIRWMALTPLQFHNVPVLKLMAWRIVWETTLTE